MNITKEKFKRDNSGHEDMLDDYWTIEILNIANIDPRLSDFFYCADDSTIYVSIAGKESGVNSDAHQTALDVLPNLHLYLKECSSKVNLTTDEGSWHLSSIWFPYQQEKMWYLHFISDYGSDLEYCFIQDKKTGEFIGLVSGWRNNDSVAHVLPTVKYVVHELKSTNINSETFTKILSCVDSNETIGREFIIPLIDVVTESKGVLKEYMYNHLLKLLYEIKVNAVSTHADLISPLDNASIN